MTMIEDPYDAIDRALEAVTKAIDEGLALVRRRREADGEEREDDDA